MFGGRACQLAITKRGPLFSSPLRIQLRNRRCDGEVPSKNKDVLVFFRNNVKISSLRRRHSRFVHFLRLLFNIVEKRPGEGNAFLTTNRSMSRNEDRVLVPGSEGLQLLPPAGHRGLRVEADRVQSGKQQLARLNNVLFRHSHYYVS